MADHETIEIETTDQAADCICNRGLGSKELRALASNAGVSRERGDTKRQTAQKIAEQDPALAARLLENDWDIDFDCSAFREAREVGAGTISVAEAKRRARHKKMWYKLKSLENTLAAMPAHEASIDWEYGGEARDGSGFKESAGYNPGITSIIVEERDDVDIHWALDSRAHIMLTPHGRCVMLQADEKEYIDRNTGDPRKQWRLAMRRMESFYAPDDE